MGRATSAAEWQSSEPRRSQVHGSRSQRRSALSSPTVVYLKQLATPRVGAESDATILTDFRTAGYLVVELDFANRTNACVPFINRDLSSCAMTSGEEFLAEYKLDDAHIFIVPEGLPGGKRDVSFYRDGERWLALDIIYPAQPKKPVGCAHRVSLR